VTSTRPVSSSSAADCASFRARFSSTTCSSRINASLTRSTTDFLNPITVAIDVLRIAQDAVGVHADDVQGNRRARAHLCRPISAALQHDRTFLAWNRRAHGAVVQGRQSGRGQGMQRLHIRRQRRQNQRFQQPIIVAEALR
jgi:hypothetical protein